MNRHRGITAYAYVPPDLHADAKAVLERHGQREMTALITATLRALVADPNRLLRLLDEHWPERKRYGRPPRER